MADETPSSDKSPSDSSETAADAAKSEEMSSSDALKKGMGLLWQAAKTAADEIQREVDVEAVKSTLR